MQNQNIKNLIDQHMEALPRDVRDAIHASSWERKILEIGRRYGLHVDQLEILQTELSLSILGLIERDEFVKEVTREAKIDKNIMMSIVSDINKDIFNSIRNHLHQTRTFEKQDQENIQSEQEVEDDLSAHEKQTLEKHGVSFNLETGNTPAQIKPQQSTAEENISLESQVLQKRLYKPLVLNDKKIETSQTQPVEEKTMVSETENTQSVSEPKPQVVEETSKPQEQNQEVLVTQENQQSINKSKTKYYVGSDPYREPI